MQSNGLLGRNEGQSMACLDGNSQPLVVTTSKKKVDSHLNKFAFGLSIESSVFIWILSTLAVISFLNLASALWVIKVLQLNSAGLGKGSFNFLPDGINIRSDVNVLGQLASKYIWSKDKEKAFKITSGLESSSKGSQLLLNAWDDANFVSLDSNKLEIQSQHFVLRDSNFASKWTTGATRQFTVTPGPPVNGEGQGKMDTNNNHHDPHHHHHQHQHQHRDEHPSHDEKVLMEVTSDRLTLSSVEQVVSPAGGINLHSTLQSNSIHGSTHHDMHLQSRRKSVFVESPEQVNIESRAGPSTLSAYGSICINSRDILQLHSKSILFSGLKATGQATSTSKASLQVCACESGLLYTVSGDAVCSNSNLCEQSPLE